MNDKVEDQLKGIHAGENSAYAAVARWLMIVKSLYGRPLDNARDADFRMLFKDMGYEERREAKKKNKALIQARYNATNYDD